MNEMSIEEMNSMIHQWDKLLKLANDIGPIESNKQNINKDWDDKLLKINESLSQSNWDERFEEYIIGFKTQCEWCKRYLR